MRTLSGYLLRELVGPLLAWLSFLFLLFWLTAFLRGTDVLLGSSVTAGDFARFAVELSPHFLMQAAPIAFLLAVLVGLGRLSEDGEVRAILSLGISPTALARGPLLLGAALSALMLGCAFTLQPWGLTAARETANAVIKRNLVGDVKPGAFHDDVLGFTLYAQAQRPGGGWEHVLVHDARDPAAPLLLLARGGVLSSSGSGELITLQLEQGSVHRTRPTEADYARIDFGSGTVAIDVAETFFQKNRLRSPRDELTPLELLEAAQDSAGRGEDSRPFRVAFHGRLGQVLMPFAFAWVGVPLGVLRRGSSRARGLLLTLAGFLGYYLLARACTQLAERGALPPVAAGQLPNLIFIGCGLLGLWWMTRRSAA